MAVGGTPHLTATDAEGARRTLAAPPAVPRDVELFSSNELFGQPGIYPQGAPMVPAAGPAVDAETGREIVLAIAGARGRDAFDDDRLIASVPEPGVRAGIALLTATFAASLADAVAAGDVADPPRTYGVTTAPGRVIGPDEHGVRVVNERYRAEPPGLLVLSLVHDLLWSGPGAGQAEEATLHALGAMAHLQLLATTPALAHTGTELARRQASLALTLLNSRRPDDGTIRAVAPDGPGTIPGGAPALQSPDFWSIPFGRGDEATAAPAHLTPVLRDAGLVDDHHRVTQYNDELGRRLTSEPGSWLPLTAHVRAAVALGALDERRLAAAVEHPVDETVRRFGLHDAVAAFAGS